jgi:hypothetical protein
MRLLMINLDRAFARIRPGTVGQRGRVCTGRGSRVGHRGRGWVDDHGGAGILRARYYHAGVSSASPDSSMTIGRCPAGAARWMTTYQPGTRPSRPSCAAVSEKGRQR